MLSFFFILMFVGFIVQVIVILEDKLPPPTAKVLVGVSGIAYVVGVAGTSVLVSNA